MRFGPLPPPLLLDNYSEGIYGAWSLRKLSSTYTGYCIQVRRQSDNATLDVGFVNDYIDTGSIYTFLSGSGNYGRLNNWYDQSGNGRNMAASVGDTTQLFVAATNDDFYSSGSFLYLNETYKQYAYTGRLFDIPAETSHTVFVTNYAHAATQYYVNLHEHTSGKEEIGATNDVIYFRSGSNAPYGVLGYVSGSATHTQNALNSITTIVNQTPGETALYFEGSKIASGSGTDIPLMGSTTYPDRGLFNNSSNPVELIMYLADKTSDRVAIEQDINDYYSLY